MQERQRRHNQSQYSYIPTNSRAPTTTIHNCNITHLPTKWEFMNLTRVSFLVGLVSVSIGSAVPILPISPDGPESSVLSSLITNNDRDEIKPFNCISKMCLDGPSGGSIPLRLLAAGGTKINRNAFSVKVRGETAWREPRGQAWKISKDYGRHGTGWKLIDPSGRRVASLTNDYRFRIRNASIY